MTKYWVLVDGEKVGEIETLSLLNMRQKEEAAQIYGKRHGITSFGLKGIQLYKAVNKDDYKINQVAAE
jgi:hypothetical protein